MGVTIYLLTGMILQVYTGDLDFCTHRPPSSNPRCTSAASPPSSRPVLHRLVAASPPLVTNGTVEWPRGGRRPTAVCFFWRDVWYIIIYILYILYLYIIYILYYIYIYYIYVLYLYVIYIYMCVLYLYIISIYIYNIKNQRTSKTSEMGNQLKELLVPRSDVLEISKLNIWPSTFKLWLTSPSKHPTKIKQKKTNTYKHL